MKGFLIGFSGEVFPSRQQSGFLLSQPNEIILPTKALGGYEDHIFSFGWLGDKERVWQVINYFRI